MKRRILVPLDGSELSATILPHIEQHFTPFTTALHLLQVVGPPALPLPTEISTALALVDLSPLREQAAEYLEAQRLRLAERGWEVSAEVSAGEPGRAICDAATAGKADLIAMATHGRGGLSRWLLGSVAHYVLRACHRPLFLARGPTTAEASKRLLVPLDGSALAEEALAPATALAREQGSSLLLLRAIPPLSTVEKEMEDLVFQEGHEALRAFRHSETSTYLQGVREKVAAEGIPCEARLIESEAASAILELAEREKVSLIVMSSHGRGALGRWWWGSVADRVLQQASGPILLVRPPAEPGSSAPATAAGARTAIL